VPTPGGENQSYGHDRQWYGEEARGSVSPAAVGGPEHGPVARGAVERVRGGNTVVPRMMEQRRGADHRTRGARVAPSRHAISRRSPRPWGRSHPCEP